LQWLLHPDTRICPQLKFCTVINFWLRDSLYPMMLASGFGQGLRRDTAQTGRLAPHDARFQLGQGLRRDSFLAKESGSCPDASSSNAYEIIPPGR
jgi:hypothetical protein